MILQYRDWSSGLIGSCLEEPTHGALCVTCCCCGMGYTYGVTQELLTEGRSGRWGECCFYTVACCCFASTCVGYSNRFRLRKSMHVRGGMCTDLLVHFCCQPCALLQEYHSVKKEKWSLDEDLWSRMGVHYVTSGGTDEDLEVPGRQGISIRLKSLQSMVSVNSMLVSEEAAVFQEGTARRPTGSQGEPDEKLFQVESNASALAQANGERRYDNEASGGRGAMAQPRLNSSGGQIRREAAAGNGG